MVKLLILQEWHITNLTKSNMLITKIILYYYIQYAYTRYILIRSCFGMILANRLVSTM